MRCTQIFMFIYAKLKLCMTISLYHDQVFPWPLESLIETCFISTWAFAKAGKQELQAPTSFCKDRLYASGLYIKMSLFKWKVRYCKNKGCYRYMLGGKWIWFLNCLLHTHQAHILTFVVAMNREPLQKVRSIYWKDMEFTLAFSIAKG